MRQIIAFFVAPLPAITFVILVGPHRSLFAQVVALWGVVLLVQLVFGVFIRIELRRQGKDKLRWYGLGGAIMLGLPGIAMVLLIPSARSASIGAVIFTLAMIAILGAVTGVTYALIAGRRQQAHIDTIDELARRFG
jgi:ATP/ADP translocase